MSEVASTKRPHDDCDDNDKGMQSTSSKKAATQKDGIVEELQQDKASISITMLQFIQLAGLTTYQPCDCSSLVKLNIPNCGLSKLPEKLPQFFPHLSILFAPNNKFSELPPVIGQCEQLQMVSFKNNNMISIHPDSLQKQLRWLILTGNKIAAIPNTIGRCCKLQKLMLSGNSLTELPKDIENCKNLELIRLACNQLQEPPPSVLNLPNLCWIALSSNPFMKHIMDSKTKEQQYEQPDNGNQGSLEIIDDPILTQEDWPILGQGAGGITRKVEWKAKEMTVAVKTYVGELTSDGSPQDERTISVAAALAVMAEEEKKKENGSESMASSSSSLSSKIPNPSSCIIKLLGQTKSTGSLIMEYLDGYEALAGPPSMESCSRDVYTKQQFLSWENIWYILTGLLQVLRILHKNGICHGDFYSHNILISSTNSDEFHVKLSDFGAAFFYDRSSSDAQDMERTELRAFGILIEELRDQVWKKDDNLTTTATTETKKKIEILTDLAELCREPTSTFDELWKKAQQVAI